ncbi:hypothetical protein DTX80_17515 [Bacilli bacterium]|uniref:hypothetical protein n=1 Tax=Oceanobacillus TaxID=182709 RepID=UPI00062261DE|nr:hypothetical protein WH51_14190 [Bacilli bacterium VT-13-104]PZD83270.1 hypothetical protein DEJ64_15490 [Bacilli bacterium]PZD84454.1 hypothetical protein DEJ60_14570 [Bacilli bacterium]PZD86678.1 hypothetical protein DEJ66_15160 [Bacilli bacterium]RCO04334.1 hypothetical protein DTX80_17515 [Bacilli bacterium]
MDIKNISDVIEDLENQVERLNNEVYNLNSKNELLENLLIKVIENNIGSLDLLCDINYIVLKEDLSGEERAEISFLLLRTQKEYMLEGKVPSLEEFHNKLLKVLGVDQSDKKKYPIQISTQLLQNQMQLGDFSIGKEILDKK